MEESNFSNRTNIKFHLKMFEIVSILISIWIFSVIIMYEINLRYYSTNSKYHYNALLSFDISLESTLSSDIKIKITDFEIPNSNSTLPDIKSNSQGYVILNSKKLNPNLLTKNEIISKLNQIGMENCFFFKDYKTLLSAKGIISDIRIYSSDLFNFSFSLFIITFFILVKINLVRLNLSTLRNLKKIKIVEIFTNKNSIFSYIIFPLTILFILPYLNKDYKDFKIKEYFGFANTYFNSYFYDRTFLSHSQENDLNIFSELFQESSIIDKKLNEKKSKFFIYTPFIFKSSPDSFSYVINILFLCVIVWLTGVFIKNLLENQSSYEEDTHSKKNFSVKKKFVIYLWNLFLVSTWFIFFFFGLLNYLDLFKFYHLLVFNNFTKILNFEIFCFLILSYLNIYIYAYFIYYTIKSRIWINKNNHHLRSLKNTDDFDRVQNLLKPRTTPNDNLMISNESKINKNNLEKIFLGNEEKYINDAMSRNNLEKSI